MIDFFAHNWVSEFEETHSWRTVVSSGEGSLSEQRVQLVERPYRSFKLRWTGCDAGEANAMRYQLHRAGQGQWQIPLYPDVWITDAPILGFINFLSGVDTTLHRFYEGHKILVVDSATGFFWVRGILSIASPGPSATLNLDAALGTSNLSAGSYVYPLVEVEPLIRSPQIEWISSNVVEVGLEVNEVVGASALPSLNNVGFPGGPGGVQDKPSVPGSIEPIYPVAQLANGANWRESLRYSVARTGQSFPQGRDVLYDLRGSRSLETLDHPMTVCQSRAEAFQVLQWHDNRKGRTRGFWFPATHRAFDVVSVSSTQLVVRAWSQRQETLDNFNEFVGFIALVGDANDSVMAGNNGAALLGDTWVIGFTSAVIPPANLIYATTGHFVRFASDSITARWLTALGTVEFGSIRVVEVLEDKPVQLGSFP